MSKLKRQPEYISQEVTENQVALDLLIPEDLHYFNGHFPGAPVLPGVVQTHWAIEQLAKYFGIDAQGVESFSNLKFQLMIRPNYKIRLELKQINESKYSFSYSSHIGQHSSGKVIFS